ncbi:MAG: AAA family ATPase, partial [Epsilonproteobacteria bacterium]|nr:AAA family ATPase [Campylobacterota bacterium]
IKSELELNKGFADLFIKPFNPYVEHFAIVEVKYIDRSKKLNKKTIKQLKEEAIKQLNQYEKDELVQKYVKEGKILHKIVMIFHGWELVAIE